MNEDNSQSGIRRNLSRFSGAFGDSALMIPFLALLEKNIGFSWSSLFVSTGLIFLAAGYFFQTPMSVQPLKSLVVSGVAVGASHSEFSYALLLFSIGMLFLWSSKSFYQMLNRIPRSAIHGLQFALGILLAKQSLKTLPFEWGYEIGFYLCSIAFFLVTPKNWNVIFGWVAIGGILISSSLNPAYENATIAVTPNGTFLRIGLIVSLALPQIVLTLGNSVLAAENVSHRLYPESRRTVSKKRLMFSIGFGNLISFLCSGLPFCHGSGGFSAQFTAGARDVKSAYIAGIFYLGCGLLLMTKIISGVAMPPALIATLLFINSWAHMKFARESMENIFSLSFWICFLMAVSAIFSKSLMIPSFVGISLSCLFYRSQYAKLQRSS